MLNHANHKFSRTSFSAAQYFALPNQNQGFPDSAIPLDQGMARFKARR